MKYIDVRENLKTGDIVLFEGKKITSKFIQYFSGSKWSHVGIVIKIDDYDMALIWESTTMSKLNDVIDDVPKRGVQTVAFSSRLGTYNGKMAVRHLNKPITDEMRCELAGLRTKLKNKNYETSEMELVKSLLDCKLFENKEDLSSLFCSELVAEALQSMGMISDALPSNEFVPKDFDKHKWVDRLMLNGYEYGDVIEVTY